MKDKKTRNKGKGLVEALKKPREISFGVLLTVGVLLSWSLVAGIVSTTEFQRNYFVYFVQIFLIVAIIGFFFSHKYLMWVGALLLISFIVFVFSGFAFFSEEPNLANQLADLLTMTIRYINGFEPYSMVYERTIIWIISFFFSFFVVFFTYHRFYFIPLFIGSATTFAILITSFYFSYPTSFYTFIFCILVLLTRRLHQRSSEKAMSKSPFTKYILPITAVCFFLVGHLPTPEQGAFQGAIRETITRPFTFLNNAFVDFTQPRDFSISQVGFGDRGGRLGGPATLNHHVFMRVRTDAPLPLYLTGSTSDTYTGYSWISSYDEYFPVDFNETEQKLEILERLVSGDILNSDFTGIRTDTQNLMREIGEEGDTWLLAPPNRTGYIYLFEEEGVARELSEIVNVVTIENTFHFQTPIRSVHTMEIDVLGFRPSVVFHTGIVQDVSIDDDEILFYRDREGQIKTEPRLQRHAHYQISFAEVTFEEERRIHPSRSSFRGIFGETSDSIRGIEADGGDLDGEGLGGEDSDGEDLDGGDSGGGDSDGALSHFSSIPSGADYKIVHLSMDGCIIVVQEIEIESELEVQNFVDFNAGEMVICYEELLNNYFIPRRNRIFEIYTTLPEDFPVAIVDLAYEVTAGATNDYQKIRMLEEYLSENYSYTLEPVPPPVDKDFVEHFLFDTRQGHCVYFATAFATMARSLGMPARYVEGFLVSGKPDEDGFVNVLNSMAHAWVEVYFEGYGWHRFEPTPTASLPQFLEEMEDEERGEGWALPNFPGMGGGMDLYQEPFGVTDREANLGVAPREGEERTRISLRTILGVVIGSLVLFVLIRVMWVHLRNARRKRRDSGTIVIHSFNTLLAYLKILGYEMKDGETAFVFVNRVCKKRVLRNPDEKRALENAAKIFVKARYSGEEISQDERITVERAVSGLDVRLKSRLGYLRYYFYRYIFAVM